MASGRWMAAAVCGWHLTCALLLLDRAQAATSCPGQPFIEYSAQPPQLALTADTALRMVIHDDGCVLVRYPRQQGGGVALGQLDATALATLQRQLDALHGGAVEDGTKHTQRYASGNTTTLTLDGDLISLRWQEGKAVRRLDWRHGDLGDDKRHDADPAALHSMLRQLAVTLRGGNLSPD